MLIDFLKERDYSLIAVQEVLKKVRFLKNIAWILK